MSAPTWNDKFELPSRSYSVSCQIFKIILIIIKKHATVTGDHI